MATVVRPADLHSEHDDEDQEYLPPTAREAFNCPLDVKVVKEILKRNINPAETDDTTGARDAHEMRIFFDWERIRDEARGVTEEAFVERLWTVIHDANPEATDYHVKFTDPPVDPTVIREHMLFWPFLAAMGLVLLGRVFGKTVCVTLDPHFLGSPGTTVTLRSFLHRLYRPPNNTTVTTLGDLMAWFRGWHALMSPPPATGY